MSTEVKTNETEVKSEVQTIIEAYIASAEWVENPKVPRKVKSYMKDDKQLLIALWEDHLAYNCGMARAVGDDELCAFGDNILDNIEYFHSFLGGWIEGQKEKN